MDKFSYMVSITNREELGELLSIVRRYGAHVNFVQLGYGTAFFRSFQKAVTYSVVTGDTWEKIRTALEQEMKIDLPDRGIVFTVPLSSVGSRSQLKTLLGGQHAETGEESVLKDTKYELIVIIGEAGCSDQIMEAAREGGARGGTVIHAKGTGEKGTEDFFGVTLSTEKEIIYTVVRKEVKNQVMSSVIRKCGPGHKANCVVMSLPVTSTAGMRFYELMEDGAIE